MASLVDDLLRTTVRRGSGIAEWEAPAAPVFDRVKVSVLIPALNEQECLPYVLPRIPEWVDEVILIDGHSTDNTVQVAQNVRPDVRIVCQEGRGKGAALRSGAAAATGDILVMLDADGSTDPAEIPTFVGALLAGADYVKGSRSLQGAYTIDMPVSRKVVNYLLVKLVNILFGAHFTDITYGYNAVWREHAHALAPEIDGWAHEIIGSIRAVRNGLRVVEVASLERARIGGQAKLKAFPAGWSILAAILCEPFRKPTSMTQKNDLQSFLPHSAPWLEMAGILDAPYRVNVAAAGTVAGNQDATASSDTASTGKPPAEQIAQSAPACGSQRSVPGPHRSASFYLRHPGYHRLSHIRNRGRKCVS